jgi:hypothetical protein
VEALLRGQPRVPVPEDLRTRVMAAFERGQRPALSPWRLAPGWMGGLVAAGALVALLPVAAGALRAAGEGEVVELGDARLLPIRVVDDPRLGMAHSATPLPADAMLPDIEGP